MESRLGSNGGILSSSVECSSPMKGFPMPASPLTRQVSENLDPTRRFSCCRQCTKKYDQELANLVAGQIDKQSSEVKSDAANRHSLTLWLQGAKLNTNDTFQSKDKDMMLRQKMQELQKKWKETCLQLHPSFHYNTSTERIMSSPISMMDLYNLNLLVHQPFQPKLQQQPRGLGDGLQLNISSPVTPRLNSGISTSTPGSPVRTDLVLCPTKSAQDDAAQKDGLKDFLGCISLVSTDKLVSAIPKDVDSFKRLLKGLIAKVWWQTDYTFNGNYM